MIDSQGENTNSTNTGSRTDCSSQRDEGIRTQPTRLYFVIKADFTMSMGSLVSYVSESQVGIVGAKIRAVKVSLDGQSVRWRTCPGSYFLWRGEAWLALVLRGYLCVIIVWVVGCEMFQC